MRGGSSINRKRYFIKKAFQLKIILRFVAILIIGVIISDVGLYFFAANELETKLFNAHLTIRNTRDILLPTIILTSIIVFTLLSLVTIYTVLYLSHKIAGPLYKFEKIAKEIGRGNLNINPKLRRKDELIPLMAAFETMLENLQSKSRNFKKNFEEIKKIEKDLNNAIQTSTLSPANKNSLSTAVKEFITDYEKNVNTFST